MNIGACSPCLITIYSHVLSWNTTLATTKKMISASNNAYTEDILDQLFCKVLKEVLDGGGREECMNYYTSTADFDAVTL